MKFEHANFLSCFFGGVLLGSMIYNLPGAIVGGIVGAIVGILSNRKYKKVNE